MSADDSTPDEATAIARVRRWEDLGGIWRVLDRRPNWVTVSLCRCDGGEEVERFASSEPALLGYLEDRTSSEE
ncbi:MAG TPA: hypothetical protein VIP98_21860 [Microlunatus sp.]